MMIFQRRQARQEKGSESSQVRGGVFLFFKWPETVSQSFSEIEAKTRAREPCCSGMALQAAEANTDVSMPRWGVTVIFEL